MEISLSDVLDLLVLISLYGVLRLCHSFKGCALPASCLTLVVICIVMACFFEMGTLRNKSSRDVSSLYLLEISDLLGWNWYSLSLRIPFRVEGKKVFVLRLWKLTLILEDEFNMNVKPRLCLDCVSTQLVLLYLWYLTPAWRCWLFSGRAVLFLLGSLYKELEAESCRVSFGLGLCSVLFSFWCPSCLETGFLPY